MRLSDIIKKLKCKEIINWQDYNITCLTHNSNETIEGAIFFCIKGNTFDGSKFTQMAIDNGAKVIVSESRLTVSATQIIVDNVRIAMALMAKNFYGRADEKLTKVAIIGTNGKTTTSYIIANIMSKTDKKVGVIGTNGIYIDGDYLPSNMTTPDPIELYYAMQQMLSFGVEVVVAEVSAHAIYYNKTYGINWDVAVFTNISEEHLDFFGTMDNYVNTKIDYFKSANIREAVVNVDDEYGRIIAKRGNIPTITYGLHNPANIFAVNMKMSIRGAKLVVNVDDDILDIRTKLTGEYNVYNIMAAIGACKMLGVDDNSIITALQNMKGVDGRFMVYTMPNNRKIIIDFAHTPDGFDKVLSLIKNLRRGKITTLFGCVGYSDTHKRTAMGKVASKYSDEIIISTDNLGTEDFDVVARDIKSGTTLHKVIAEIPDRARAIQFAIERMQPNDTLVLLGKGVENKQVIGDEVVPYSDVDEVKKCIRSARC